MTTVRNLRRRLSGVVLVLAGAAALLGGGAGCNERAVFSGMLSATASTIHREGALGARFDAHDLDDFIDRPGGDLYPVDFTK